MFNSLVDTFLIATRTVTKGQGISLPAVHGAEKGLDLALKPELQNISNKVLTKPVTQSQPIHKVQSNTKVVGSKFLKSVKFLRRDQRPGRARSTPVQQQDPPIDGSLHNPVEELIADNCDVIPAVAAVRG